LDCLIDWVKREMELAESLRAGEKKLAEKKQEEETNVNASN
jgi:hypothetical protein